MQNDRELLSGIHQQFYKKNIHISVWNFITGFASLLLHSSPNHILQMHLYALVITLYLIHWVPCIKLTGLHLVLMKF